MREGDDAHLSVHDNGAGISADFLPHVFELFRQGGTKSSGRSGLGIGLAIVSQIVKLHGAAPYVPTVRRGAGLDVRRHLPSFGWETERGEVKATSANTQRREMSAGDRLVPRTELAQP